jgi:hypothetical protein
MGRETSRGGRAALPPFYINKIGPLGGAVQVTGCLQISFFKFFFFPLLKFKKEFHSRMPKSGLASMKSVYVCASIPCNTATHDQGQQEVSNTRITGA